MCQLCHEGKKKKKRPLCLFFVAKLPKNCSHFFLFVAEMKTDVVVLVNNTHERERERGEE